jgi:hypothetical protein
MIICDGTRSAANESIFDMDKNISTDSLKDGGLRRTCRQTQGSGTMT